MDVRQCVTNYIKTLDSKDKERIKAMISHNVVCGYGYAKANDVDVSLFNEELRKVLGGK